MALHKHPRPSSRLTARSIVPITIACLLCVASKRSVVAAAQIPRPGARMPQARVSNVSQSTYRVIADEARQLRILIRHQLPTRKGIGSGRSPVLFVHGASFPSALAAAFRFDGIYWMDDM